MQPLFAFENPLSGAEADVVAYMDFSAQHRAKSFYCFSKRTGSVVHPANVD
jgi:hypothetical protein